MPTSLTVGAETSSSSSSMRSSMDAAADSLAYNSSEEWMDGGLEELR